MHKAKVFIACLACVCGYLVGSGSNVLAQCTAPEKRATIIAVASAELHVTENLGPDDALRIREYKQIIKSKFNYPVAWCAIFVSYVYKTSNLEQFIPNPGKEWVPSWSARKQYIIYKARATDNQQPCAGDVVTFYYPRLGYEGHIGLVKEWPATGDYFKTIEGNWGGGVKVVLRRKTDAYRVMRYV